MSSLAEGQARFIDCLQKGPAHFPADLFQEDQGRALLGLKAHANTISHARLVALEDSFPRLYDHMGHAEFNALSRGYVEKPAVMQQEMSNIGAGFADFLQEQQATEQAIDLARIEWGWLKAYHSAEASPLALEDIASLTEEALLNLEIGPHPALQLIRLHDDLPPTLSELNDGWSGSTASDAIMPDAIMIARPNIDVLLHPQNLSDYNLAKKIANIGTMSNLLQESVELVGEAHAMEPIIRFVQAGVMIQMES